jgi:hypothetical protein
MVKEEDLDPFDNMHTPDFLALLTHSGVPPHELTLKPGAICTIMRNMSIEKGLVKNSRVLIQALHDRFVEVRPLDTNGKLLEKIYPIPRIRFSFNPPRSSWTVDRLQFPLRLAHTFHSCLGLMLDCAAFDFRTDVFAHGQLYTAISRMQTRHDGLAILKELDEDTTANIVYSQLISW